MADSQRVTNAGTGRGVKTLIVAALVVAVGAVLYAKKQTREPSARNDSAGVTSATQETGPGTNSATTGATATARLPRLVDVGAGKCIPCIMMAPILDELKTEYAGIMDVQFVDVWENPGAGEEYGVELIPTQIFYDASGKERFRHQGFFGKEDILAKWKELDVSLASAEKPPSFSRWDPAKPDDRPKDSVCYLCDGGIDPKTRTVMKTPAGNVAFCSPHCYLITYASLTDEKKSHQNVAVTDWSSGNPVPATSAVYVYGMDTNGRPTTKAFADEASAINEQQKSGGNVLAWAPFEEKEMATRCAFCDRPVYPEDASIVRIQGIQTWGCCVMCALGVAARTGKDIEVTAKDASTGEPLRVKTYEGHVAELTPPAMVAWAGAKKDAEGKSVSTGCFKQAFFANEANLKQWVELHPTATGSLVSIEQALAAKMRLTPQQISKACKIGECAPR